MPHKIVITSKDVGKRADVVVSGHFPRLSRAFIQKLFEAERILKHDKPIKPGYKLQTDDVLETDFQESEVDEIEEIDLPILYEDENVLVINKPVGVISHSRGRYWNEPSVASFVRQKTGQAGERSGIVHRLDRATSGVMVCSKNAQALSFLQKQFSQRKAKKTYLAVVTGHCEPKAAIIDMPIERNPKAPSTFRVGPNGKPSVTHYTVIESAQQRDLLELKPETGRTHQLRVHLKHIGHAIVGDELYGGEPSSRLMLHAHSLEITLPGGKRTTFSAPIPEVFYEQLKAKQ